MMMRAIWKNVVIAESENTVLIEGSHYFPKNDVKLQYFKESKTQTICSWKGIASYYTVEVNGEKNIDSAWFYLSPKEAANQIKEMVAFWNGIEVVE